ncbi:MAG: GNAT family protein [Betaproteobacteria bacterium]
MIATSGAIAPRVMDSVILRAMVEADLPHTLAWRNDDRSRPWFKDASILQWTDHVAWFRRRETAPFDRMYVAERKADGCIVAQAAIYHIDLSRREAEVGRFLTDPDLRGRGYFALALEQLLHIAHAEHDLARVHLEVLAGNARAIAIYHRAGFATTGREDDLVMMERNLA